ncbi:cation:proton antiporter [Paracoccus pacificus]|uniref:Cation:proton antiporter n=1 Tax=Paracoccus pacificus TaxID=1463598 RepID=A0ABW4R289_9RHOB
MTDSPPDAELLSISYEMFLAFIGFGVLAATIAPRVSAWLPVRVPLSLPIACLFGGMLIGSAFPGLPQIDPIANGGLVQRVTEMAVILSLTGCALKLDRVVGWHEWRSTWRLLGIAMPLCIAVLAITAQAVLGLSAAAALLLAAALAPTDPVLAGSVQVGPPGEETESEARFALTSEAGLNDGLAFPFVFLAMMTVETPFGGVAGWYWLWVDVIWKIGAGLGTGWLIGWVLARLVFRTAKHRGADAFLAVGMTLFTYGVAETIYAYGFIAVFVAGLVFRRYERNHSVHRELHHFVEQVELLFLVAVIFVLGIALAQGLLAPAGWVGLGVALMFLFVIRPVAGWIALTGAGLATRDRAAIAVLGIRGVGTFFYLSYAMSHAPFPMAEGREVWAVAALAVTLSVVLHGLTAPGIMRRANDT